MLGCRVGETRRTASQTQFSPLRKGAAGEDLAGRASVPASLFERSNELVVRFALGYFAPARRNSMSFSSLRAVVFCPRAFTLK
jgi:hypothetical protein